MFPQIYFLANGIPETCASTKPNYSILWDLFYSLLHFLLLCVPISPALPYSLLLPLRCPNFQFLSTGFSTTSPPSQRDLPLLSTPTGLYTSSLTFNFFSYLFLYFASEKWIRLMTWSWSHSFSFAQLPSPVFVTHWTNDLIPLHCLSWANLWWPTFYFSPWGLIVEQRKYLTSCPSGLTSKMGSSWRIKSL